MYLLYLDESGTQAGSPAMVLAGLAVHELDSWPLQERLDRMLRGRLPQGLDPLQFELHANEIKSPRGKSRRNKSNWAQVPVQTRFQILRATYKTLANFRPTEPARPMALFGAVVDRQYADQEQRAYEEVLHKFDEMLTRQTNESGIHQLGMVIHDKHLSERKVQSWTDAWRHVAGRIGRLTHLTDVPMFADSKASRLIQAADFVAWGLYRNYGESQDETWIKPLWSRFDSADGVMHGLIHVVPGFRSGKCNCPPCSSRHFAASI